ncbi:HWE histidine kinase domain-containing protein [Paracoccus litorisediminis]|jgi:light-regulated signal transduction histidine kinase (bacteriophytochrome)/CheY-like chemotaxis protein|uniref:histidine kinase n=1 Tax=Paracoccus litorisediminis TaxID=2006130 RepID=A0A844HW37_9RHOB|nr:HWE histidine kinase domain-containing protein [Paracoccus litorisediminis]MTH61682.1 GAF domain-containing protein [Paracoccus litorisediminis]
MTSQPAFDASLVGQPIDLSNCDREPIHIPGSIQPHGCLLACDNTGRQILQHSANATEMLGLRDAPVGQDLVEMIGHENAHRILNTLAIAGARPQPGLIFGMKINDRAFDVSAHRFNGRAIIEFEPAAEVGAIFSLSRSILSRLRGLQDPEELVEMAAALIQAQIGYDRVMIYELGPDGAGKVVSEAKREHLESFLGQYFPASDIPQQARALYLRNPIRVIGDASCQTVPLCGTTAEQALDLSYAHLRSVSPIHCEYLRNMGVSASMSVSIIINGVLWGLIACHHYTPKVMGMAERAAAEMIGEFFAMHLDTLTRRQARHLERAAHQTIAQLLIDTSHGADVASALRNRLPDLSEMIEADGLALYFDGTWTSLGCAPNLEEVAPLLHHIEAMDRGQVFSSSHLAVVLPEAGELTGRFAGALVVPLSQRSQNALIFIRREALQTLNWAGDPSKNYESGPHGDRLTPRKSFAIWKETVRATSMPWSENDLRFAEALRNSVVEVMLMNSEILAEERARAATHQNVLNQELNHRVKNILALIKSLINRHPGDDASLPGFIESLNGRIQALSAAHDQVVRDGSGGRLGELIGAELGPYLAQDGQIEISGPMVELESRAYSIMALVLHEMATNAAKYGALAHGGHLRVVWTISPGGDCRIAWTETGLTGLVKPSRSGFGSELLERALPFDLGGASQLEFRSEGLAAEFTLPARFIRLIDAQEDVIRPSVTAAKQSPAAALTGARVLIVEDQALIALSLESDLIDHGMQVSGIAGNVAAALRLIDKDAPDLAVLDVNLNHESSLPIAERLLALAIPFVFATGYGSRVDLPDDMRGVPVVEKPYQITEILAKLREARGEV